MKRTASTGSADSQKKEKKGADKTVKGAVKAEEKKAAKKVVEEEKKGEPVDAADKPAQAMNNQIIEQIERLMKYLSTNIDLYSGTIRLKGIRAECLPTERP